MGFRVCVRKTLGWLCRGLMVGLVHYGRVGSGRCERLLLVLVRGLVNGSVGFGSSGGSAKRGTWWKGEMAMKRDAVCGG